MRSTLQSSKFFWVRTATQHGRCAFWMDFACEKRTFWKSLQLGLSPCAQRHFERQDHCCDELVADGLVCGRSTAVMR